MTTKAPGSLALHPVVLASLAIWALNDHVLKSAFPGTITGKLSDVASLIAFPALATAACELWASRDGRALPRANAVLVGWALATAFVMVAIRVPGPFELGYRWGLGTLQWPFRALVALARGASPSGIVPVQVALDPTDAFTVPAALVPVWLGWRAARMKAGAGVRT